MDRRHIYVSYSCPTHSSARPAGIETTSPPCWFAAALACSLDEAQKERRAEKLQTHLVSKILLTLNPNTSF
jgi:hypothetical protein